MKGLNVTNICKHSGPGQSQVLDEPTEESIPALFLYF